MNDLDRVLLDWYSRLESEYRAKTKKSFELYKKSTMLLPHGVSYSVRYMSPYPLFIERAKYTRLWDVDGNEYIDYWMGHGSHLLGHIPDVVVKAVEETMYKGTHFGLEYPELIEYIELLLKMIPHVDMIRFTNSGTEANTYAVRLARAYTRRKHVVKIEGGWHGSSEILHVAVTYPYDRIESAGLLEDAVKYTIAVPFNDINALEKAFSKHEVAALIMEPVMGAAGCLNPDRDYLREVRRVVDEYSSLLILDEVITGFRLAPGGAQEYYDIRADIVVVGKALGGGVGSTGGFLSRAEVMELMNPIKYPDTATRVFHGGTFVSNPLVVRAGYAMLKYLSENRGIYVIANNTWSDFRKKIDEICGEYDYICWSTGEASLTGIHFTKTRPRNAREVYEYRWSRLIEKVFHLYARINGLIYTSEKLIHLLPSLIHSEKDAERFIEVFSLFLDELSKNRIRATLH